MDRAVDLGINRLRLEAHSGLERPFPFSKTVSKEFRYKTENDNPDASKINPEGFQFELIDKKVELIVMPVRKRLPAKGESLFLNLTYVNFGKDHFHRDRPEEYAEFMLAIFLHLRDKYGVVPDMIEIILEADGAGWNAHHIAEAIISTSAALSKHGFHPGFSAPSASDMTKALNLFDELMKNAKVRESLIEFPYHRYRGVSPQTLLQIGERAQRYRIQTAMLERIGASYKELHEDLKTGQCSSWEQYTLAFPGLKDTGGSYFRIDDQDPEHPVIIMAKRTAALRQYFKFIRRGAVRVEASTTNPDFDPLGFINTNGKYAIVIKSSRKGTVFIAGLTPGNYGISYGPDVPEEQVDVVKSIRLRIPGPGATTIYAK